MGIKIFFSHFTIEFVSGTFIACQGKLKGALTSTTFYNLYRSFAGHKS